MKGGKKRHAAARRNGPPPAPQSPPTEAWWPSVLVVALVAAIYLPSLSNGFSYDDDAVVPGIAQLLTRPGPLHRFFSTDYFFSGELTYRPIVTLTYLFDAKMGGTPFAFHMQSLVWQLLAVGLVLALLKRLGASPFVRYGGAALYGVHPVLTEAVDSIAFREDVLVTSLGLAGLVIATGGSRERTSIGRILLMLACFVAAMFAKESGVVFLLLLPLTDWAIARQSASIETWRRARVREYAALAACTIGFMVVRFVVLPTPVVYAERIGGNIANSVATGIVAIGYYLKLLVYPHPLCADYRGVVAPVQSAADWRLWTSLFVVVALSALAWTWRQRNALGWWGWAWFLIAVSPVSHIVPLATPVAERFMHLPYVGVVVFAVTSVATAARAGIGTSERAPTAPRVLWIGAGVLVIALSTLTWARHVAWSSNESLWRTTLADFPNAVGALHGYGSVLVESHRDAEAVPYLTRALASPATTREARGAILLDLGSAYSEMGEFERARQAFADSASSNETPKAYLNWGLALIHLQQPRDAEEKFRAALRLDPALAEAHSSLGGVFAMRGENDAAIAEYREALRLKPSLASAQASLGVALANQGRLDDAISAFLSALDLDPKQAEWHYDVAVLFARRGERDAAIRQLEAALQINPGFERARETLRSLGR